VIGSISGHSTANLPIRINHNHPCIEKIDEVQDRSFLVLLFPDFTQCWWNVFKPFGSGFYAVEFITKPLIMPGCLPIVS
jgi:hypothetical protein